ncbi:MAG: hypothetical protein J7K37_01290 [Candidatus Omnitrophica bacterium]|nr:hypothetical protein [Candidatus Omnitrophota bacterium]
MINRRVFLLFQVIFLIGTCFFLLVNLFFPFFKNTQPQPEITPDRITFPAKLNLKIKSPLVLISFDSRAYIEPLGLWRKYSFQKALQRKSLFLVPLPLEIIQDWVITNNIDYYHAPFSGKILFLFEGKDFSEEVDAKLLVKNYEKLSLENLTFLGLGLREFLMNSSKDKLFKSQVSPDEFLENLFSLKPIINKKFLPEKNCKVKIAIFK